MSINNQIKIKKLPKSEVEIIITIPWEEIKKSYDNFFEKAAAEIQIKGFRKGKAPKKIIEEQLDKSKIYSQVIQEIIPKYYEEIIKTNNFRPLITPKITLVSAEENSDWEVKILICEEPQLDLGNYKDSLAKLNKNVKIWVPGEKQKEEDKNKNKEEKIQKIVKWFLENIKIELSDLVIEEEVNRRLSELIEQTQKVGLTVDQYLASIQKTPEELKNEYRKQALEIWQLELILNKISEEEKIVVENKEIDELIQKVPSEEEKRALEEKRYLLASVIRRQKTLDFLANL